MQDPRRENLRLPRSLRNPARDAFASDAFCPRCDYNLKGLSPGNKCPECGSLIVTPARATAQDENITAAPRTYLVTLAAGLGIMTLAGIMAVLLAPQRRPTSINWVVLTGVLAGLFWLVGSFIVTIPAPHAVVRRTTRRIERHLARFMVLFSQACWVWLPIGLGLAAEEDSRAMALAATFGQPFQRTDIAALLSTSAWAAAFIGLLGWLILAYILADLSQWASDSALAERFRITGVVIPLAAPVALLGWAFHDRLGPISLLGLGGAAVASVALIIAAGLMLVGLGQLTSLTVWAVKNKETGEEFARRRDRRERTYEQDMIDRLDPTPAAPPAHIIRDTGTGTESTLSHTPPPLVIPSSEHVLPRRGSPSPYDLDSDPRV